MLAFSLSTRHFAFIACLIVIVVQCGYIVIAKVMGRALDNKVSSLRAIDAQRRLSASGCGRIDAIRSDGCGEGERAAGNQISRHRVYGLANLPLTPNTNEQRTNNCNKLCSVRRFSFALPLSHPLALTTFSLAVVVLGYCLEMQ